MTQYRTYGTFEAIPGDDGIVYYRAGDLDFYAMQAHDMRLARAPSATGTRHFDAAWYAVAGADGVVRQAEPTIGDIVPEGALIGVDGDGANALLAEVQAALGDGDPLSRHVWTGVAMEVYAPAPAELADQQAARRRAAIRRDIRQQVGDQATLTGQVQDMAGVCLLAVLALIVARKDSADPQDQAWIAALQGLVPETDIVAVAEAGLTRVQSGEARLSVAAKDIGAALDEVLESSTAIASILEAAGTAQS